MKQVLLAIDGDIPTNPIFQYSVGLCKRIRAELSILQFTRGRKLAQCISTTKKGVGRLGKFLEDSFAGIAFAEEGAFCIADEFLSGASTPLKELIKSNKDDVAFKVVLSDGEPETEISNYIENHQDIVLMVFDPSKDIRSTSKQYLKTVERIKKNLCIPMVVVKA
ncbi:MAG: hypothetical protein V1793_08510 [Pseudomonadota bacterium]